MDVIRARVPTSGINEIEFPYKQVILRLVRRITFKHNIWHFNITRETHLLKVYKPLNNPRNIFMTGFSDLLAQVNWELFLKFYQHKLSFISEIQYKKPVYAHFTNATDTRNIDRVFESCIDVVFKISMEKVGFM
uniref:Uncharacterized protein n=1 Tax=Heterorhabditis bacteriophora TaxID=37862 RepID=A0A1I7WWG1_HETBA